MTLPFRGGLYHPPLAPPPPLLPPPNPPKPPPPPPPKPPPPPQPPPPQLLPDRPLELFASIPRRNHSHPLPLEPPPRPPPRVERLAITRKKRNRPRTTQNIGNLLLPL